MKCVKFLTIATLMVSASAVYAMEEGDAPKNPGNAPKKAWTTWAKETALVPVKFFTARWEKGKQGKAVALGVGAAGVLASWYALSKVSKPVRRAWNAAYLGKATDKVEDTVSSTLKGAKDNGINSKEGYIVTGVGLAGTVATFYGLNKYFGWFDGSAKAPAPKPDTRSDVE